MIDRNRNRSGSTFDKAKKDRWNSPLLGANRACGL
jgi:hypothetical protein